MTVKNIQSYSGLAGLTERCIPFLRAGEEKAKPTLEGTATTLKIHKLDPNNTRTTPACFFTYGGNEIPNSRYLVTYTIYTCVAIVAYDQEHRFGFLAHAQDCNDAVHALEKVKNGVEGRQMKTMTLYGGDNSEDYSVKIASVIEGFLIKEGKGIEVIGRDLLRGNKKRMQSVVLAKKRDSSITIENSSIALDTETGEVFIPSRYIENLDNIYYLKSP